jgi:uncharacterized Ntn-hydrolase superfamily protein
MTFSLVGRCQRTGMLGLAIGSSSVAVASRCAWVRAGVGAVATQNITDPRLGRLGLDLMEQGLSASAARDLLIAAGHFPEYRQLALIDREGSTAHHSGTGTLGRNAAVERVDCVAAGNLLKSEAVPAAMAEAFSASSDLHLADRLLLGIEAGLEAGGEVGPVRSAGLVVADRQSWPICELRVDWHETPIAELRRVWAVYEPQMADYLTRALDPAAAPSYGVPGDP